MRLQVVPELPPCLDGCLQVVPSNDALAHALDCAGPVGADARFGLAALSLVGSGRTLRIEVEMVAPSIEVVGREAELASVERFLDGVAGGPRLLVIEGEAGIGKTTVWEAGVAGARERLYWLLLSRPAEAETKMSYAGLGDLFEPVLDGTFAKLPAPQRHALEVALLRRRAKGAPADPRTLGVAAVNVLRYLAEVAPVVVAVDDLQWLDSASAGVLDFALRRLETLPVGMLATWRTGERRFAAAALARFGRIRVDSLDAAAVERVIRCHLGARLPPPTLHRLHKAAGGNPFFALEIARAIIEHGELGPGDPLPIPDDLEELVTGRLNRLPARTRRALVAATAVSRPTRALVAAAVEGGADLDKAERAGVIAFDGDAIRFTHPLLAAALYASAAADERRTVHRRLADLVEDPEERARHLALAADGPDEEVAAVLEAASQAARSRGAPETAAELAEQAASLTLSASTQEIQRRKMVAAAQHVLAADLGRARTLIEEAVSMLAAGPLRARALVTLATVEAYEQARWKESWAILEQALREAGDDVPLRASIARRLAWAYASALQPTAAEEHVGVALDLAPRLDDRVLLAETLAAAALVEFLRGRGLRRDLLERAVALETLYDHHTVLRHPYTALAMLRRWTGDFAGARSCLETLLRVGSEQGEENVRPFLLFELGVVEFAAGNWADAVRLAEEAHEAAAQTAQESPRREAVYLRILVDAYRGNVEPAYRWAEEQLRSEDEGDALEARMMLGLVELSSGNADRARGYLEPVLEKARLNGVEDPSVYRFWPDAIEALVGGGELDRAERVLEWFEERGRTLARPRVIATAFRCRALLCAAHSDLAGALVAVEQALREHQRLPQPFDLARTLLVKGRIARRAKQKRVAREALEQALEIFDRLGAALWAKQAREELGRIGGRAMTGGLTPTQQRIAELVASGHTNREVAEALFVTVKTVEANLSKIYRKVGVASRRELARELGGGALVAGDKQGQAAQT